MAVFSVAEFNAAVEKINNGIVKVRDKTPELEPAAAKAANHWYVPNPIGEALKTMARWAADMARTILDKIIDVIQGLTAPLMLYADSKEWASIQTKADTISGNISEERLKASLSAGYWRGPASETYFTAAKLQPGAAAKVSSIAGTLTTILTATAIAGAIFYVGLAVIIVKFVAAMVSAIAEFGVVIASLFGLATILEEFATVPIGIAALVTALVAFFGPQITELINSEASLNSDNGFPDGNWPVLASGTFNNSSVKGEKEAPWSVKPGHDKEN